MLNSENKILGLNPDKLSSRISMLEHPIVFTNGCFDILHRGHVSYLQEARNLGSALIVGVNSDASVKQQNKGQHRPINHQDDRIAILASLACVDAVILFEEETPLKLIQLLNPDILVKGGDWPINTIVGADHVMQNGGTVHSIEFQHERSTTMLINKIRSCDENN